ncbi:transglutaminaseTgpA domain-containing protein [Gulosibacter sediminis]|uniref:transglutaminase family protein n=1 Tax=Gulosibacter sediminis TaxID=1729695 RepID=UPI0018671434|nr:DUF3488 and transglutaminase-like domain-containing protein [Gulosibacter sediminis]
MSVQSTLNPRRNSAMRERAAEATQRGSWFVTTGLVLLMLAALTLVAPIVNGFGWFLPVSIAVVVSLVAVQAARQFTGQMWVSAVVAFSLVLLTIVVLSAPGDPVSILSAPFQRFREFSEQVASDTPPIRESQPVTLMIGTVAVALSALADIIAQSLRAPAFAPITLLPLIIVPVTVGVEPAAWYFWALTLLALVLFFYVGHRWLQQGDDEARAAVGFTADGRGGGGIVSALIGGVAAIAVAALIAVLLPPTSGAWWGIFNGNASLATNRVNPIIDLGDDLRRDDPVDILRYATSQSEGQLPYLSLTTLTQLSSDTEWVPGEFDQTSEVTNGEQPAGDALASGANVLQVNSNIVLEQGVSAYLPHIGTLNEISDLEGDYLRDEETGDLREADDEPLAQSYQGNSTVPRPTEEQISTAPLNVSSQLESYTQLPDDSAALDEIRAQLEQVVDANATPYEQALQLQAWFTGGAFDYSEQAPVENDYDGTSLDVITEFLQVRSGYCVHFSSAMAVMGRLLGIPTRIQVGFTPGTEESVNAIGQSVYVVTTDDLHAWAEFWLPGYGWVPFETTPSDGLNQPTLDEQAPEQTAAPTEVPTPTTEAPTPTPTPTDAEATPDATDDNGGGSSADNERDTGGLDLEAVFRWVGIALAVLAPLALIALLLLLPKLLRQQRTATRRRQVRAEGSTPIAVSEAAWQEVLDTARDYGVEISRSATTGAQRSRLARELRGHDAALAAAGRLTDAHNAAHFADPERPDFRVAAWDDVATIRAALHERAGKDARRAARTLPLSALPTRMRGWLLRRRRARAARQRRKES